MATIVQHRSVQHRSVQHRTALPPPSSTETKQTGNFEPAARQGNYNVLAPGLVTERASSGFPRGGELQAWIFFMQTLHSNEDTAPPDI